MSATPKADAMRKPAPGKCLALSVAQALAEDPALEAVTVDHARHTISVATLGKTDVPKLTERISATIQQAEGSVVSGRTRAVSVLRACPKRGASQEIGRCSVGVP